MSNWKIENGPVTPAPIRRTRDGLAWNSYPQPNGGHHHQIALSEVAGYTYDETDVPALVLAAEDIRDYAAKRWAAAEAENAERRTAAIAATADRLDRMGMSATADALRDVAAGEVGK